MAKLVALDTPNQDLRSIEEQFLAKIQTELKNRYQSVPNVTSVVYDILIPNPSYAIPFTVNYNGWIAYAVPLRVVLLPDPLVDLRMREIKEVVFTINLYEIPSGAMGYTPPSGAGNFNIRFTYSINVLRTNNGRLPMDLSQTEGLSNWFTLTFPYNLPEIDWNITNNPQIFRLSNTIVTREPGDQNFLQLTREQYDLIRSKATYLVFTYGFLWDDYNALSNNNKTFIDQMFRAGLGGLSVYQLGLSVKLTYLGFLSSFD